MKILLISFLLMIFILNNGCDESVDPIPIDTSGETTITSKVVDFKSKGFSFQLGGLIDYPNSRNIMPDMLLLVHINSENIISGVFFSPPNNQPSFRLLAQINDADSARNYFSELSELPDTTYNLLALTLKENQIWAVKTYDERYAKILIINTEAYLDSTMHDSPTPYGEALIKWAYQPNGSRIF